jgi:hypothetical protein
LYADDSKLFKVIKSQDWTIGMVCKLIYNVFLFGLMNGRWFSIWINVRLCPYHVRS